MKREVATTRFGLAVVVALLAAVACSAPRDGAAGVDAGLLSAEDRHHIEVELLTECMAEQGFEYRDLGVVIPNVDPLVSVDLSSADVVGYGVLVEHVRIELAGAVVEAAFADEVPSPEFFAALHGRNEEEKGGCRKQVDARMTEDYGPPPIAAFADTFEQLIGKIEGDAEYQNEVAAWAECMLEAGYAPSSSPMAQRASYLPTVLQLFREEELGDVTRWRTQNASLDVVLDRVAASDILQAAFEEEIAAASTDRDCRRSWVTFTVDALNEAAEENQIPKPFGPSS